jgi:hypothetical protein
MAVGCGGGIDTVSVTGTIKVNGEVLEGATVIFTPVASKRGDGIAIASHGTTDASGKYTLKVTTTDQSGVVVGKHTVSVAKFDEPEDPGDEDSDELGEDPLSLVPIHDLSFTVTSAGSDAADFDIEGSLPTPEVND